MIAVRCSLLATILLLAVSTAAAASDEALARARDLYRSAAYDEALALLDRIAVESSGAARLEANEYRLLCYIALDRKIDARVAIESMVRDDPFHQLSADAAPPRVRALFTEIRQSLLPGIVQREYTAAKAAFDGLEPDATARFERVLRLIDDPQVAPTPALTDLRMVASGFRDLSRARAPKVEFAGATAPSPPPPTAVGDPPAAAAAEDAAAPARSGPAVYRDGDPTVVPPAALAQALPQWIVPQGTRPGAWQPDGVLEVTIDEAGSVVSAVMRKPFHPSYDPLLLKTALTWKYEPARRDGVPVRFVKMVAIRLDGTN